MTIETWEHPELGTVLADNSGAAGEPGGNAYSAHQGPASEQIQRLLDRAQPGEPPLIDAALASDGWWWRVA